jgi:hypothetical protein
MDFVPGWCTVLPGSGYVVAPMASTVQASLSAIARSISVPWSRA